MTGEPPTLPWRVEASRTLVDDRWLTLHEQRCVTAEGHVIAPFYVSDLPDWVQVVAIDDRDRMLMVRLYRHALGIVSLELPGGAVDAADADPVAAGARELREETGAVADDWRLVATLAANPATQTNRCDVVLARGVRIAGPPADEPAERLSAAWMPVDEVVARALAGEVQQAIHVAALAMVLGPLGRWRPAR